MSAVEEPSVPTTIVLNIKPPRVPVPRTVARGAVAGKRSRRGE
jgi:hypothetical protein